MLWGYRRHSAGNPALRAVWFADLRIAANRFAHRAFSRQRVNSKRKVGVSMCQKTISMCQGKGSLSHNNRAFAAKNIDSSRTADNITFVHQNLRDAYDILFSDAVERYNARQKRNDRRIPDYFQHLFSREPSASVITGTNEIVNNT